MGTCALPRDGLRGVLGDGRIRPGRMDRRGTAYTSRMSRKIRVGLVFGGRSCEHEVSLASARSVFEAIDRTRYDLTLIHIAKDGGVAATGRGRTPSASPGPEARPVPPALRAARIPAPATRPGPPRRGIRQAPHGWRPGRRSRPATERAGHLLPFPPPAQARTTTPSPSSWATRRVAACSRGGSARRAPIEPGGAGAAGSEAGVLPALDVVFPLLHGPFGEDGTVQGLLELAGLPYVGAGVLGSAAAMDKAMMKRAFRAEGLPMTDHLVVRRSEWRGDPERVRAEAEARLGYPMFVKPANLGSSVGVHRIDGSGAFRGRVEDAAAYDTKVLIEAAALDCHEIECAVLGNDEPRASVVGEIVPSREFYDYDAKYVDDASKLVIPAPLPPETAERVRALSLAAFRAVDARGLSRVDFFVERGGERRVYVNEVNTMPGFTPISMYPKLWAASGVPLPRPHRPAHPARHRGAPGPARGPRRPLTSVSRRPAGEGCERRRPSESICRLREKFPLRFREGRDPTS